MKNPFEYQSPTPDQVEDIKTVRNALKDVYETLNHVLPAGREKSLAITKLQEVSMWANCAIVMQEEAAPVVIGTSVDPTGVLGNAPTPLEIVMAPQPPAGETHPVSDWKAKIESQRAKKIVPESFVEKEREAQSERDAKRAAEDAVRLQKFAFTPVNASNPEAKIQFDFAPLIEAGEEEIKEALKTTLIGDGATNLSSSLPWGTWRVDMTLSELSDSVLSEFSQWVESRVRQGSHKPTVDECSEYAIELVRSHVPKDMHILESLISNDQGAVDRMLLGGSEYSGYVDEPEDYLMVVELVENRLWEYLSEARNKYGLEDQDYPELDEYFQKKNEWENMVPESNVSEVPVPQDGGHRGKVMGTSETFVPKGRVLLSSTQRKTLRWKIADALARFQKTLKKQWPED